MRSKINQIMDEYSARMDEINHQRVVGKCQPSGVESAAAAGDNGRKYRPVITGSLPLASNIQAEPGWQVEIEDYRVINASKLKVCQANISMTALQKDLNKMEVYKKILTMVRRGMLASNRNYWKSVLVLPEKKP
ncbi:MAG: hypothetical protein ABID71_09850 [Chloroflexota bacterium]